ncbi:putative argininosuccinate lyase [Variovorax paradoxus B4]|uniref:argininosuccinate lyase n=1 Tax=Variovorax paradoxus B4 TaxID=1246301 RepID=T1X5W0_VARPD|nr:argininosuccinate lyase [Variovorax paradoxus]AGU47841.1 putative argininosuccinate lyase [Variovorax paradoxus B4]
MKSMAVFISACIALASMVQAPARAADTGDTACRTTAECQAQVERIKGGATSDATSAQSKAQDFFYWVGRINMASTVVNVEQGIIPAPLASKIAAGVAHSIDQAGKPGGRRPTDVLQIEKLITDQAGPEATLIHSGRSRQDIHATLYAAQLRTELLDFNDALNEVRTRLLASAAKNVETFVPAYTNGVQAMPISYAHYLLAFADSFGRDAERLQQVYVRVNRSALGTAVLSNSSWLLDRRRLASLLGFDALLVNSLDAGQISTYDIPIEAANLAGSSAIRVGAFMQDVHVQYHQVRPWLLLAPGKTYTSSAMPQKANPGVIQNARGKASDVVGAAQMVTLRAHNVTPGMTDYKNAWSPAGAKTFVQAVDMMKQFADVLDSLRIDPKRSLEELDAEWTTSMELAETLQRTNRIPFRVGHHFASEVVVYARAKDLKPKEFPYAEAVRIYAEAGRKYQLTELKLPLDEIAFRQALSAENMVRTRVGIGGPQPEEVRRMLAEANDLLAQDRAWVSERRAKLTQADASLNQAFFSLIKR